MKKILLAFYLTFSFNLCFPESKAIDKENISQSILERFDDFERAFQKGDLSKSNKLLDEIRNKKDSLSKYERAKLWQAYGTLYYSVGGRPSTIQYLEKAANEESGVFDFECEIHLTLVKLNYLEKNYSKSVTSFEQLKELTCNLTPDTIVLGAISYTGAGDYPAAKSELDKAYHTAKKTGTPIPEHWDLIKDEINEALEVGYSPRFLPKPKYPKRALSRGTEGHVKVKFDIDEDGNVYNPIILDSSSEIFHRSVLSFLKSNDLKPFVKHWKISERQEIERTYEFHISQRKKGEVKADGISSEDK